MENFDNNELLQFDNIYQNQRIITGNAIQHHRQQVDIFEESLQFDFRTQRQKQPVRDIFRRFNAFQAALNTFQLNVDADLVLEDPETIMALHDDTAEEGNLLQQTIYKNLTIMEWVKKSNKRENAEGTMAELVNHWNNDLSIQIHFLIMFAGEVD